MDIFISYSRADIEAAMVFYKAFTDEGWSIWIDQTGIETGDAFKHKITDAIESCKVFVFLSSKSSNASKWVANEIGVAMALDKPVIPVKLDGARYNKEVLLDLVNLDYIDYYKDKAVGMAKVISSLRKKIGPGKKADHMVETSPKKDSPLITMGLYAGSFAYLEDDKKYAIGDVITIGNQSGVVFYLDASGKHGKIVSTDSTIKQWCTKNEYLLHRETNAVSDDDGTDNLKHIQQFPDWEKSYPAFKWCSKKGEGWYLPTIEELRLLAKHKDEIAEKMGGIDEKKWYWSSEEESVYSAKYFHFMSGQAGGVGKDTECIVLAVAEF